MFMLDPTGHISRINMFDRDTLFIPTAGDSGIYKVLIIKYGIWCFNYDCGEFRSCVLGNDKSENNFPVSTNIGQNFPNPFNPSTVIQYVVSSRKHVSLKVCDVLGREVATLVDGVQDAGIKSINWDATGVPSGVYFYRLRAGNFIDVKKMLLLR